MNSKQTVISLDIDWAPDECIAYACTIIKKHGLKATLFATHSSPLLKELESDSDFEIAIHPNLYSLFQNEKPTKSMAQIIDEMLAIFPNSEGIRTHGLVSGFPVLNYINSLGLKYDASSYVHLNHGIKPYKIFETLKRIVHTFEDDVNFALEQNFNAENLINQPFVIVDFHPIHIFLNTHSVAHYEQSKIHYKQPEQLKKCKFDGPGTETLFRELCQNLKASETRFCKEII